MYDIVFKAEPSIRFGAITRGFNSTNLILFINLPVIEFHLKFLSTSIKQFVCTREWESYLKFIFNIFWCKYNKYEIIIFKSIGFRLFCSYHWMNDIGTLNIE